MAGFTTVRDLGGSGINIAPSTCGKVVDFTAGKYNNWSCRSN
jgi:hypothetical protein